LIEDPQIPYINTAPTLVVKSQCSVTSVEWSVRSVEWSVKAERRREGFELACAEGDPPGIWEQGRDCSCSCSCADAGDTLPHKPCPNMNEKRADFLLCVSCLVWCDTRSSLAGRDWYFTVGAVGRRRTRSLYGPRAPGPRRAEGESRVAPRPRMLLGREAARVPDGLGHPRRDVRTHARLPRHRAPPTPPHTARPEPVPAPVPVPVQHRYRSRCRNPLCLCTLSDL